MVVFITWHIPRSCSHSFNAFNCFFNMLFKRFCAFNLFTVLSTCFIGHAHQINGLPAAFNAILHFSPTPTTTTNIYYSLYLPISRLKLQVEYNGSRSRRCTCAGSSSKTCATIVIPALAPCRISFTYVPPAQISASMLSFRRIINVQTIRVSLISDVVQSSKAPNLDNCGLSY